MTKLFFDTHIFCCLNERAPGHQRGCCKEKGAEDLHLYFKNQVKAKGLKKIRVNKAGCLDRCEEGPAIVIYPEGVWYSCKSKTDIDRVIEEHLLGGKVVESLCMRGGMNSTPEES